MIYLCPNCGKEFNPNTGRRPKKFCSDACRSRFHNSQKTRGYVKRATYEAVLAENLCLKERLAILGQNKPIPATPPQKRATAPKVQEKPVIKEKTGAAVKISSKAIVPIQSVAGVDLNALKENAIKNQDAELPNADIQAQINDLEEQKKRCGEGLWGKKMREKLQSEINHLKSLMK